MNRGLKRVFMAVVVGTFLLGCVLPAFAQRPKSKEEIEAKIRELERRKQQELAKRDANRPQGADLDAAIATYEKKHGKEIKKCADKKNDQCVAIMDSLSWLYRARGNMYLDKNNYTNALADYDRATQLSPNDWRPYNNRGYVYAAQKDYNRALAEYNNATRLSPDDGRPYVNRAEIFFVQKDYDRAIADINTAIRLDANRLDTNRLRANKNPEALEIINKYERLLGGCSDKRTDRCAAVIYNLAVLYSDISDYSNAMKMSERLRREYPSFPKTPPVVKDVSIYFSFRGEAYFNKNDYSNALADFNQAIRLGEKSGKSYYFRGLVYQNKGDYDNAIADFNYALKIVPTENDKNVVKQALNTVQELKNSAAQAAKQSAQAALEAVPPVPIGTGYDRVPWGASSESVKNVYLDLKAIEDKNNDGMTTLGHKDVGGGISGRKFCFAQDKLLKVIVDYGEISEIDANLLVEKITSIYGKPISQNTGRDRIVGNQLSITTTTYNWEYNKKTKITLKKYQFGSDEFERNKRQLKQQGLMGEAYAMQFELMQKQMLPLSVDVEYIDMVTVERLQNEAAAREKKQAEEAKKKRSDGLGL